MDSGRRELAASKWADLPVELVPFIHRKLATCRQIIRFRSVCRRWRFSTPPPPNKLSCIFPLRPSFLDKPDRRYNFVIYASAVYLDRRVPRSLRWMVCVQESSAGNLVLRHPLFYKKISNSPTVDVADSISTTQTLISRSYAYNERCRYCKQIAGTKKVAFVRESSPSSSSGSGSGSSRLVGLCAFPVEDLLAFKMEVTDCTTTTIGTQFHRNFVDFATFNGRIFAVDKEGQIHVVDHASLYLIQLNSIARPSNASLYFVVSDGDLYLVSLSFHANPPTCLIYRLRVNNNNNENKVSMEVEKVEDLGDDRVFFIGKTCSFSVSARDLPPPCKGNCIVFGDIPCTICECKTFCSKPDPGMFMLGGQNPRYEVIQSCFLSLMLQMKDHKAT